MGQSENIDILEVGLRDGLQILPQVIPTTAKLSLLNGLIQAGCRRIEVTSFVNSKRISQFEDAEKLISQLPNFPDVKFSALVLNEKGLERHEAYRDFIFNDGDAQSKKRPHESE